MPPDPSDLPQWDSLYEIAASQEGQFTTQQAADAGYSPQLLAHHVRGGRVDRVRRGVYRLVHFPPGENEELVTIWLWSEQAGVFSHQSALWLHELSDVMPQAVHLTLPEAWRKRRFRVPPGVELHHADVEQQEQRWVGAVPITSPARTLNDVAQSGLSPELLRQATLQALSRGLCARRELKRVAEALKPFGGLGT